jgi:ElaB/YqjD/DUF883 family membrane-anchored ribosome-binding protein
MELANRSASAGTRVPGGDETKTEQKCRWRLIMVSASSQRAAGGRNLRDQSRRVLRDMKDLGTIAADDVVDGKERLKARGREMLSDGRDALDRYQGQVKKYIAANPFKTLFMAVGVGTLLGLALRRRD